MILDTLLRSPFLDRAWEPTAQEVEVWACGPIEHAEPPCLVALAAWAARMRERGVRIRVHDSIKGPYAWQLGLLNVLAGKRAGHGLANYVPPTVVRTKEDKEQLLQGAPHVLGLSALSQRSTFQHIVSEALRNVVEHARVSDAFVCGSYFPSSSRVTVSIADLGLGVPGTIRGRLGEELSDMDANRFAVECMVSGATSTDDNAGLGLYVMRTIAGRTGGLFTLLSRSAYVQGASHMSDVDARLAGRAWPGTIVTVTFDPSRGDEAMRSTEEALSQGFDTNRKRQPVAWGPPPSGAASFAFSSVDGTLVEDKDEAKRVREEQLLPTLASGAPFGIDLSEANIVTHSFVHALLYKAVILYGEITPRKLYVQATSRQVKHAVRLVGAYAMQQREDAEKAPVRGE
jgi:anti-sigma regulatory factor (Ser/Thr protein kinase)